MKRKPRTIPAIEPNAGTRKALEKRLKSLSRRLINEAALEILGELFDRGVLANDAALSKAEIAKTLREQRKLLPSALAALSAQHMSVDMAERIARLLVKAGVEAKKISEWFVRTCALEVSARQQSALHDAGISTEFLREKYSVPIIRRRYLTPHAAKAIPKKIEEFTGLITKMAAGDLERVQSVIASGLSEGMSYRELESTLAASQGFSAARAARVALDQSVKVSQAIQRENAKALGITEAIWVHVPGQYSSRPTHIAMNGKRFELSAGLWDEDVGMMVVPGQLPYCRCSLRTVLPPELLK